MIRRLTAALFLCAALSGCGGGGGGSSLPQTQPTVAPSGSPPAGAQHVTLSITIPAAPTSGAAAQRRPRYVSANTQSAKISVNGGTPVIANLAANSLNCTTIGGARTCTVTISAPVGPDTFSESLYASTDGTGTPLSLNTAKATIVAGKANTVNLTLGGVVASMVLTLTPSNPPVGVPATISLAVNLLDASGATIIGGDPLVNPVTLIDSDTSPATYFPPGPPGSKTKTLNTPADAAGLTVTYTGAQLAQAVFTASATGASNGTATLTPSAPTAFVDWPTYAFDSQRSGFNPNSTAVTPGSIANLHLAWQVSSAGDSQTQPVVATNIGSHQAIVIVGNFDGVAAYDAVTGASVWQRTLGTQNLQTCGSRAPISGTPFYDRALGAIFIAGGDSGNPSHDIMYKLDVSNGNVLGSNDLTPTLLNGEAVFGHTAVTFANGELYVGTSSNCEGQVGGLLSWRGRVVEVDPNSLAVVNTFFTTYGQNGNIGGGGVWGWGGVSADPSGNIYTGSGNAETASSVSATPPPPFVLATDEQAAYAEHLTKLTPGLVVQDSNKPVLNFQIGCCDLDYTGTPVIYQPPLGSGCDLLSATQGKGGTLVINDTQQHLTTLNSFALSVPSAEANYIGNPAYSPTTGLLYAAISSSGSGSLGFLPGMAAIGGCGSSIVWRAAFGPDSTGYSGGPAERSGATVTAGGVVFMGTNCTPNGHGGCGAPGAINGAVWAVDAASGTLLGSGGNPVLLTGDRVIMAPTVDGEWVYVLDNSGNLYGLTVNPSIHAIAPTARHVAPRFVIRK